MANETIVEFNFGNIAEELDVKLSNVIAAYTVESYKRIKVKTPVDTGRARASWFYELEPDVGTIYNTVDYILELENGSSKQAPEGMVAITLAEMEHFNIKDAI